MKKGRPQAALFSLMPTVQGITVKYASQLHGNPSLSAERDKGDEKRSCPFFFCLQLLDILAITAMAGFTSNVRNVTGKKYR